MYKAYEVVLPIPHRYTEGVIRCGADSKSFQIPANFGRMDTLSHVMNTMISSREKAHPPQLVEEREEAIIYWIFTEPIPKSETQIQEELRGAMWDAMGSGPVIDVPVKLK